MKPNSNPLYLCTYLCTYLFIVFKTKILNIHENLTVTVGVDVRIQNALRTTQTAGFVTLMEKMKSSIRVALMVLQYHVLYQSSLAIMLKTSGMG